MTQQSPSMSSFAPLSPNNNNNTAIGHQNYPVIQSPTSDAASSVRSFNCNEDYSDCERDGPPSKLMRQSLVSTRIRDGRELLQCPTIGCDGNFTIDYLPHCHSINLI